MKKIIISVLCLIILIISYGCESPDQTAQKYGQPLSSTGFLSDYSQLRPISETSYRYLNPKYSLAKYVNFIIDPVELIFNPQAKAEVGNWDDIEKLRAYMRKTFVDTLEPRYNAIAVKPGPSSARIRIALTNVERSAPLKLGSVSMEVELLDTQTSEQIAALIETQKKGVPFYGYDQWSGAKSIMDDWAKRFYNRLEESRGH